MASSSSSTNQSPTGPSTDIVAASKQIVRAYQSIISKYKDGGIITTPSIEEKQIQKLDPIGIVYFLVPQYRWNESYVEVQLASGLYSEFESFGV